MAGTMLLATALSGGAQVASAVDQRKAAKRAERKQQRANDIERARADVNRGIERRRAIAKARQAQASNFAAGISSGITASSSPLQGAISSIGADLGTSQSFANAAFTSGQQSFDLRQSAAFTTANANANAAIVNATTNAVQTLSSFAGGGGSPTQETGTTGVTGGR